MGTGLGGQAPGVTQPAGRNHPAESLHADWQAAYQARQMTAEEAIARVHSGQRLYLTGNTSVPRMLLDALVARAPALQDVVIYQGLTVAGMAYVSPEMQGHLRVNTIFNSPNLRAAVAEGRADFTPVLLSQFPRLFSRRIWSVDVALAQVSPPDAAGYCSFGSASGIAKTPVESAAYIIAEVNDQMLPMPGDTRIHTSRLDCVVPVSYPPDEMPLGSPHPSDVALLIATHVAEVVPDGATLQIGIGEIPDAVLQALSTKKDLGLHSETFSDSLMPLVESGVVNGARKTLHPGKLVAGFVLGTRNLYRWASSHPLVELHPTEYINDPAVIARNYRMTAINSAIEIDLTGQVCADSLGPLIYSGVGGQMDFIYGAALAEEGVPVIAMNSTAVMRDGRRVSRIAPSLQSGAGVTVSRNHVHYVATEYGIVNLYAQPLRQRCRLLISIAHPDFRDELAYHARKLNYL